MSLLDLVGQWHLNETTACGLFFWHNGNGRCQTWWRFGDFKSPITFAWLPQGMEKIGGGIGVLVEDESENPITGWWFQYVSFFLCSPLLGEDFQFDCSNIFQMG